ncbi:hypothetical protein AGOR_G00053310 [Albula goreensis]|uniref:Tumor necrosis factor receptor superfamily member 10B-like n=1 Tax=Albula goreensis TaxID=1534307 RepID=A0A8T3DV10_9TELE|nr:hypothetical protein AGOR_G00053310 [Albula goreensis]
MHSKMNVTVSVLLFILAFSLVAAVKSSTGIDRDRPRLTREITCTENLEYLNNNFCCKNCPAGTFVKTACEKAGERGRCETCDYGWYTEHENGLTQCLKCTQCRKDQEVTEVCTTTKDTVCQCKQGTFCVPDQACEVCKNCAKCKADEETVKNCNTTSNTVCRKKQLAPSSISGGKLPGATIAVIVICCFVLIGILLIGLFIWKKQRPNKERAIHSDPSEELKLNMDEDGGRTVEEQQNSRNAVLDGPQPSLEGFLLVGAKPSPVEDEDRGLGDSLPNTTNSSQTSLTVQPATGPLSNSSPHPSPETQRQPVARGDVCRRLIPVNGLDSWKNAFDIIEKYLNIRYCSRFFRHIGLEDNTINDPHISNSEDRVYRLLNSWMEKKGLAADLNDLIEALLKLDQKWSAENIIQDVTRDGYFKYEDESS